MKNTIKTILNEKDMLILTQALHDLAEYEDITHAESKKLLSKIKDINYAFVTKVLKESDSVIPEVLL